MLKPAFHLHFIFYCSLWCLSLISYSFFPPYFPPMSFQRPPSLSCVPIGVQLKVSHESDCTVEHSAGDGSAAGWLQLWRASRLSSAVLFVRSDGRTGNSRMIQRYRVRIYDNVPWGTFPYNEHSTSSLEALLRNEDEDTQIKRNERKGDQGRFQE